jgi:catechol 2,3-dioxygenase-like lactoylglutathione lyase family enzyme
MEPRVSLITLGVADLERSFKFYSAGLGLPTNWRPEKGVIFFQTSGTTLALYPMEKLAEDIGEHFQGASIKFGGVTLAHNTRTQGEVDLLLMKAKKAGAKILKAGAPTFWGGYSGYFSDPDGHVWEVAYGAFPLNEDGSLQIP